MDNTIPGKMDFLSIPRLAWKICTSFQIQPLVLVFLLSCSDLTPCCADDPPTAFLTGPDGAEMVLIPGGTFRMGSPDGKGFPDEHPQQEVALQPFYLDRYEVTEELYARFDPNHTFPNGHELFPATRVSWEDASRYAEWAGKRLPTEAEWEYAATGGDGRFFPWGNDWNPSALNWNENGKDDGYAGPAPVHIFSEGYSPFGIASLSGNVMEWVQDIFHDYGKPASSREIRRVLRGGAWIIGHPAFLRCQYREARPPRYRSPFTGFRCAMDPPPPGK